MFEIMSANQSTFQIRNDCLHPQSKSTQRNNTYQLIPNIRSRSRCPRQAERNLLQLLPGAVHRHHLRHLDPPEDVVLLLQPDRAVRADCVDGPARVHTATGLWREAFAR